MHHIKSMTYFVLLTLLSFSFAQGKSAKESKNNGLWESYGIALKQAQEDHLPIFVEFYADWCIPCQVMEANVFSEDSVAKVLKQNFHPVRLNVDSSQEILCEGKRLTVQKCYSEQLKLQGIPTFVILNEKGVSMLSLSGAMSAEGMQIFLKKILNEGFRQ